MKREVVFFFQRTLSVSVVLGDLEPCGPNGLVRAEHGADGALVDHGAVRERQQPAHVGRGGVQGRVAGAGDLKKYC